MLAQGKAKEEEFKKFFKRIFDASREEDMKEHWDFGVKFDVKMMKSVKRHQKRDENIHWVELKNVNGEKGWLYGEADFFSFETTDYWIVVNKETLQDFIQKRCTDTTVLPTPTMYRMYQRKGRQDIITLVKSIDLMYISSLVIEK